MTEREVKFNGIVVGTVPNTGNMSTDAQASKELIEKLGLMTDIPPKRVALAQARAFGDVSYLLFNKGLHRTRDPNVVIPFIVNTAFGIELYLKALALADGLTMHGHDVGKLFEQLPETTRDSLLGVGAKHCAERKVEDATFETCVREVGTAFTDWRYAFEKERLNFPVQGAIVCILSLDEVARSRKDSFDGH